jgi:hypothetical protein
VQILSIIMLIALSKTSLAKASAKVTGGKEAVSSVRSGHFRRQSHRSSYSICKSNGISVRKCDRRLLGIVSA